MANVKITDLTELAAVDIATNDVLPIVDINNDSTKKVTIASIKTLAEANDLITFTRLNANLNVLDANADAIEARRVANVTLQDAIETRRAANVTLLTNEDTALQARITTNAATAASNDFITFTRLNANLDIVQDNVAALSVTLGIRGDGGTNDDVTVGTEELVFKGDTGITTSVSSNVVTIDLDDTAVTAGLYGGVSGGVTNVAAVTIDATGRITNAANVSVVTNLDTLQDNINVLDANADAIETRRVANVTEQTAIEARRVANIAGAVSTITTGNLTASRALTSDGSGKVAVSAVTATELGHLDGVTSAIQTQFTAAETRRTNNIAGAISTVLTSDLTASRAVVSGSGGKLEVSDVTSTEIGHLDGVTSAIQTQINDLETRRNANVTVAGANNAAVESRRVANIAGAISTVTTGNLTASRALTSSGSGKIAVSDVTATELGHLDGVTSGIQSQLDAKIATTTSAANDFVTFTRLDANIDVVSANATAVEARRVANIAGAVSSLTTGNLTASRALVSDGSGKVAVSDVTSTELGHLDGVTGAIQTQFTGAETRRTNNIAGAVSSITTSDLTASRAVVSDSSGKVAVSAVTATEIGHLDGVTSAIQTQFTGAETRRTNNIAGAVSTITTGNLTASRALASSGSGKVAVSAVTATELGYLDGVTSGIQTQLDAKAALAGATFTGQVNMSDDLVVTGNLIVNGDTTTVSTTNLDVEDRMIMLADGVSGSPSADVGLLFNRGNQGNAAFFYDESASTFKLSDTKDPKSNTSLSPITSSNLDVGIITAATVTQNGADLDDLISSNVDGAVSTVNDTNLTASRALVSSGSGKIAVSDVTATELGHLDGVSSAIQTQLNAKQATITGAATTIDDADLTASRALVSSGSGKVAVSAVTATELGHLDGVTSAIQTQINAAETRRTNNIAGAISTVLTSDLTASRAIVSGSGGKIEVSAVTSTEIGHLDGVTSAIQTQINAAETRRTNNIAGAVSTITTGNLTASRAVVTNGSGKLAVSDVTSTELGHLDGVTSAIQTQFTGAETRRTNNIAGAVSSITTGNLTASRALASDSSGKVAVSAVTSTELGYLDGVTSAIQTQLNAKQATITGAATTIDDADLTASRALVSSGSGKVAVSAVTATELGYLDGVTSAIQTQFTGAETRRTNNIAGAVSTITTGNLTASRALVSDGSGKVAVSVITSTELGHLDGIDQNINSNLAALASGIQTGSITTLANSDTDFGTLTTANIAGSDAFGQAVGGVTNVDLLSDPTGELDSVDLVALS